NVTGVQTCALPILQEAGVGAGLDVPPGAPLVHHEAHLAVRVVPVHDGAVAGQQLVHVGGAGVGGVPLVLGELGGASLVLPRARQRVVVQGDGVERTGNRLVALGEARPDAAHEGLGPVDVAVGGAGGDAVDLVARMIPHVRRVLPRESDIVLGLHVAAAAPGLVADAEVGHLPRLVTAVGPAQGRHRRV